MASRLVAARAHPPRPPRPDTMPSASVPTQPARPECALATSFPARPETAGNTRYGLMCVCGRFIRWPVSISPLTKLRAAGHRRRKCAHSLAARAQLRLALRPCQAACTARDVALCGVPPRIGGERQALVCHPVLEFRALRSYHVVKARGSETCQVLRLFATQRRRRGAANSSRRSTVMAISDAGNSKLHRILANPL